VRADDERRCKVPGRADDGQVESIARIPGSRLRDRIDRGSSRLLAEAGPRAFDVLANLDGAILRGRARGPASNQALGGGCNLLDDTVEERLVRLGGLVRSADLANELKRGRANLRCSSRRLEVCERSNIAANDLNSIPRYRDRRV